MNWCKPHWNMLRIAIDKKGLTKFVATTSDEADRRLASQKTDVLEDFEPLLGCWMRINLAMVESPACNGRHLQCPLCILVEDGQPEKVDNWLDGCTDDALKHAIKMGWMPRPMKVCT